MIASLVPRTDYASLKESVYLNQASLGLLSQPVVRAMHGFLDDVARHGNLHLSDEMEVDLFDSLRRRGAGLFKTDPDRIAVVSGASEILGQAPHLVSPVGGRKVLMVASDFPAVTRPWLQYAKRGECAVQFIEDDPRRDLTSDLIAALDDRTAVIAVSKVQYATGTQVDVPRLRAATRAAGSSLIVDASQAAGATRIDAAGWDAEIIVSSGYKWLGGHGGVALAVMAPTLLERLPLLPGWMGVPNPFDLDATRLLLADDARRYTLSTMSYVSFAGLNAAIDQLLRLGDTHIENHARRLAERLIERAAEHGWRPYRDLSDPSASSHIIALTRSGGEVSTTLEALRSSNIVCSSRGGRVRVSLAPYNDESDVDLLVDALR